MDGQPWFNPICVGWLPQEPVASRECLDLRTWIIASGWSVNRHRMIEGFPTRFVPSVSCASSAGGRTCWREHVMVERFWRSLKYECVHLHAFEDPREVDDRIAAWIEFYNYQRMHLALENRSPPTRCTTRQASSTKMRYENENSNNRNTPMGVLKWVDLQLKSVPKLSHQTSPPL